MVDTMVKWERRLVPLRGMALGHKRETQLGKELPADSKHLVRPELDR